MPKSANSEQYRTRMELLHGPDWRSIFSEAQRRSSRNFVDHPELARKAGEKGRQITKEKHGEDFYKEVFRSYWRAKRAGEAQITVSDEGDEGQSVHPRGAGTA